MGVGILYGVGLGLVAYVSTSANPLTLLVAGILGGLIAGGGAIGVDQRIDGVAARRVEMARAAEARHAETMLEWETKREIAQIQAEQAQMAQRRNESPVESDRVTTIVVGESGPAGGPIVPQQVMPSAGTIVPQRRPPNAPATRVAKSENDDFSRRGE